MNYKLYDGPMLLNKTKPNQSVTKPRPKGHHNDYQYNVNVHILDYFRSGFNNKSFLITGGFIKCLSLKYVVADILLMFLLQKRAISTTLTCIIVTLSLKNERNV